MGKNMEEVERNRYCKKIAQAICYEDGDFIDYIEGKEARNIVTQLRGKEKLRKISRSFRRAREDVMLVDQGKKPLKPFVSDKDYGFWKMVVAETEKCLMKEGRTPLVSNSK